MSFPTTGHSYGRKFQLEVSERFPEPQKGQAMPRRRHNLNPKVRPGCPARAFRIAGSTGRPPKSGDHATFTPESLSPGTRRIGLAILSSSAEQVGVARL